MGPIHSCVKFLGKNQQSPTNADGLKQQIFILKILEVQHPKSRGQQGHNHSRVPGEDWVSVDFAFLGLQESFPVSASDFPRHFLHVFT